MSISKATLERLPKYLRILKHKSKENVLNISSTTIANELKLNSIQVRKDLALVSKNDGKPGIGFDVNELINDIENFLDLNNTKNAIIIGAGRLGQALMNYNGFENSVEVVMAFDNDENICDNKKIFHISKIKKLIKENNIHIGIITVPKEAAQEVCNSIVESGITAIWNFSPTILQVPQNIIIRNEDLSASLSILISKMNK